MRRFAGGRVYVTVGVVSVAALLAVSVVSAFAVTSAGRSHRVIRARVAAGRVILGPQETASNRRRAIGDAAHLLAFVVPPPGAVARSSGAATGPHAGFLTSELASAVAYQSWTSPEAPSTVLAEVISRLPSVARVVSTGSSGPNPISSSRTYAWPSIAHHLGVRWLQITVTTRAVGGTLLTAKSQSEWIVARPRDERVPAGVTNVMITDGLPSQRPQRAVETRDPSTVRALIRLIDDREILQPGVSNCPSETVSPIITVDFRAPSGSVLARATTSATARASFPSTEPGWACSPVDFSVRGHTEPALPGNIVTPMQRLLRISLPSR